MQDFNSSPRTFSVWIVLAALVTGGLFAAPPASAQDYRLVTAKALARAVSGISEAKANYGLDQVGGTNPVRPKQASRQEETSPEPGANL